MENKARARILSEDGETIIIHRFHGQITTNPSLSNSSDDKVNAVYLDLETTGLNAQTDKVIEIGILHFSLDLDSGEIIEVLNEYSSFQDPGTSIPPRITELTGIDDEMVQGKQIDQKHVEEMIRDSKLVIAHNAAFDRGFLDPLCKASREAAWGCSLSQVPWDRFGYPCKSLTHLCMEHGFFYDAHRALTDVKSAVHLLGMKDPIHHRFYLKYLFDNAFKPSFLVKAIRSPFETKDLLKARRFRWDPNARTWYKRVGEESLEEIRQFLDEEVYQGKGKPVIEEIPPQERFKS